MEDEDVLPEGRFTRRPIRPRCPHAILLSTAPNLIVKKVIPRDVDFELNLENDPMELPRRVAAAMKADDLYGMTAFGVEYSMDKKKRWKFAEVFADQVEELQDPQSGLHRSLAEVSYDRLHACSFRSFDLEDRLQRTNGGVHAVHDVDDQGMAMSRVATRSNRSTYADLTTKPRPRRPRMGDPKKRKEEEKKRTQIMEEGRTVREDRDTIHVRYATVTERQPSIHLAQRMWRQHGINRYGYYSSTRGGLMSIDDQIKQDVRSELIADDFERVMDEEFEEAFHSTGRIPLKEYIVQKRIKGRSQKYYRTTVTVRGRERRANQPSVESVSTSAVPSLHAIQEIFPFGKPDEELTATTSATSSATPGTVSISGSFFGSTSDLQKSMTSSWASSMSTSTSDLSATTDDTISEAADDVICSASSGITSGFGSSESTATIVHYPESRSLLPKNTVGCVLIRADGGGDSKYFLVERCSCTTIRYPESPDGWRCLTADQLDELGMGEENVENAANVEAPCCQTCFMDGFCPPFRLPCGHVFCESCWIAHANVCMTTGQLPVPCMYPNCSSVLSLAHARLLFDSSSFLIYRSSVFQKILSTDETVSCPSCRRIVMPAGDTPSDPIDWQVLGNPRCVCGTAICLSCRRVSHRPLSCEQFEKYAELLKMNGASMSTSWGESSVVKDLVRCPLCRTPMQRSTGCNHMTCPACRGEFCYVCGASWAGSHYNCQKTRGKAEMTLVDVVKLGDTHLLSGRQLLRCLQPRAFFHPLRTEIFEWFDTFPVKKKIAMKRTFDQALQMVEFSCVANEAQKRKRMKTGLAGLAKIVRPSDIDGLVFALHLLVISKTRKQDIENVRGLIETKMKAILDA